MRVEITGAIMIKDNTGDENLYLPLTGGQNCLTGVDCTDKTKHNDFEVQNGRSSLFITRDFGSEAI